jgi:hypothetical protein
MALTPEIFLNQLLPRWRKDQFAFLHALAKQSTAERTSFIEGVIEKINTYLEDTQAVSANALLGTIVTEVDQILATEISATE